MKPCTYLLRRVGVSVFKFKVTVMIKRINCTTDNIRLGHSFVVVWLRIGLSNHVIQFPSHLSREWKSKITSEANSNSITANLNYYIRASITNWWRSAFVGYVNSPALYNSIGVPRRNHSYVAISDLDIPQYELADPVKPNISYRYPKSLSGPCACLVALYTISHHNRKGNFRRCK